jgi:hypothetical protein
MWIEEKEIGCQIGGLGMNAMAMSVISLSFDGEGGWWLIFSFRFLGFGRSTLGYGRSAIRNLVSKLLMFFLFQSLLRDLSVLSPRR